MQLLPSKRRSRHYPLFEWLAIALLVIIRASDGRALTPVDDATYDDRGSTLVVSVPSTECSDATSTPIVVGDYLILPMHDKGRNCTSPGKYGRSILAFRFSDRKLYEIAQGSGTEGTLLYQPAQASIFWPVLTRGAFVLLDSLAFSVQVDGSPIESTCDSSATWLDGLYYFGTINSPDVCQQPVRKDCGAIFGIDAGGQVVHRIDVDRGLRMWVTGSPVTDGVSLYAGGGSQRHGSSDDDYLYGCSVVKLTPALEVLASADPDDPGCEYAGRLESAVAGEPVLGPDSIWAQFIAPGDDREKVAVIRYDRGLNEICRVELDGSNQFTSASYYQAPTVDRDGNAYFTYTLPDPQTRQKYGALFRATPDCEVVELDRVSTSALASPTLADDRYVLFATEGRLLIRGTDGSLFRDIPLGSNAQVVAAPVLHDGTLYVFATDGTLTIVPNSGLSGYGSAYWPRFRHDNAGSGRAVEAPVLTPTASPEPTSCPGDCDASGTVTVDELILGVQIALGEQGSDSCPSLDSSSDDFVSVDELIAAVAAALRGCIGSP